MKLRSFIKPTHLLGMNVGWGNGYVVIPPSHPFFGKNYDDIGVQVHGGLTFGTVIEPDMLDHWTELRDSDVGCFLIGFDTAHWGDAVDYCSKTFVQKETQNLLRQCLKASK